MASRVPRNCPRRVHALPAWLRRVRVRTLGVPAAVGLLAVGTAWIITARSDRAMRDELLREARVGAFALDANPLAALEGGQADTASPAYWILKRALARLRAGDPRCRFAYLMGRRNGEVFFFADSEPSGSADESPPGQIYTEASPELLDVFRTGREAVAGPWKDRWGTWVSAFVVLHARAPTVVLGMDVDARGWRRSVVARAALPVLLVVLASGLGLTVLRIRRLGARSAESERKIRSILRGSPIGIGVAQDRVFIEVNDRFCDLTGLSREQLIGRSTRILYPDDEEYARVGRELYGPVSRGEVAAVEARVREAVINAAALERNRPELGIAFAVIDTTERRRVEEALRGALAEKDLLLKEVHHRVKNNLQAVVGLIGMRLAGIADQTVVRSLKELQEQVRTMALVYEQVYRAGGTGHTAMDSYLQTIVRGLIEAMGDGRIQAELSVEPFELPVAKAMACGLIVTELVTNALKHGFVGSPRGRIEVGFASRAQECRLWVADDGIGWRPGTGFDSPSASGLQMVRLWATHQLGGTIEASGPPGTRVAIVFPHREAAGSVKASPSVCASA